MFIYNKGKATHYLSPESERFQQNFEVYCEDSSYEIKNSDIVDLYMHDNCIELIYYSDNSNRKSSMGIDALCGISLRISNEYNYARIYIGNIFVKLNIYTQYSTIFSSFCSWSGMGMFDANGCLLNIILIFLTA